MNTNDNITDKNTKLPAFELVANQDGWKEVEMNGKCVEIPDGWEIDSLGNKMTFKNGDAHKPDELSIEPKGVRVVRIQNLTNPDAPYNYTQRQNLVFINSGDIIFSWSATIETFVWKGGYSALNQHLFLVKQKNCHPAYLKIAIDSAITYIRGLAHGATMQHVRKGDVENTKTVFPPLPEQTRIATVLSAQESHIQDLRSLATVERQRLSWLSDELLSGRIRVVEKVGGQPSVVSKGDNGVMEETLNAFELVANQDGWKEVEVNGKRMEIPKGWETNTIGNSIQVMREQKNHQIPSSEILKEGLSPVISQEQDFINGYTNQITKSISQKDGPWIVFGDHTTILKYVDFDFVLGGDGTKVFKPNEGDVKFFYFLLKGKITPIGYSRHFSMLKEKHVCLPKHHEQTRIATVLSAQEQQIADIDALIDVEQKRLQWLTEELLSGRIRVIEKNNI